MLALTLLVIHQSIYCQLEFDNHAPANELFSIENQQDTIRAQADTIKIQRQEILKQRNLLDSLDNAILIKEKLLEEKQKVFITFNASAVNVFKEKEVE